MLSNIALHEIDCKVAELAEESGWNFTRYADDIVLSGMGRAPADVLTKLDNFFGSANCWSLSSKKRLTAEAPQRLKVHGLLVNGKRLRLTKGYRNRIRAFVYLWKNKKIAEEDERSILGHILYARQIDRFHSAINPLNIEDYRTLTGKNRS